MILPTLLRLRRRLAMLMLLASAPLSAGTEVTELHRFAPPLQGTPSGLVLDGSGWAYAVVMHGGRHNLGGVVAMRSDGSDLRVLHHFVGGGLGARPQGRLAFDGVNTLYGVTGGGPDGGPVLFKVNRDGSGFGVVYGFTGFVDTPSRPNPLLLRGDFLYGTFASGCASAGPAAGCLYRVRTDGTQFLRLKGFTGNSDGGSPIGPLAADASGRLYGVNAASGSSHAGNVYSIRDTGADFKVLHQFSNSSTDGSKPPGGVALDASDNLYGMTSGQSSTAAPGGTIFKLKTDGSGFQVLHTLPPPISAMQSGTQPTGTPCLDDAGNLYGDVLNGGGQGWGGVFRLSVASGDYALIYSYGIDSYHNNRVDGRQPWCDSAEHRVLATTDHDPFGAAFAIDMASGQYAQLSKLSVNPDDGWLPMGGLVADGAGHYFGVTREGGAYSRGTVYTIQGDGTGFKVLHSFGSSASEGTWPEYGLSRNASGRLFGTTAGGGLAGFGTVYALDPDGSEYELLHTFLESEGRPPTGRVIVGPDGLLYGTTWTGGVVNSCCGSVFRLDPSGTGYEIVHPFATVETSYGRPSDGVIVGPAGWLYGASSETGSGSIYRIQPDGSGFQKLHDFGAGAASEGREPSARMAWGPDDLLYGSTFGGGDSGLGVIFRIQSDGSGYQRLHAFVDAQSGCPARSATPGPYGDLFVSGACKTAGPHALTKIAPTGVARALVSMDSPDTIYDALKYGWSEPLLRDAGMTEILVTWAWPKLTSPNVLLRIRVDDLFDDGYE